MTDQIQSMLARSADGTDVGYVTVGEGPALIIVGGVLSSASTYLPLARALAHDFTVHVLNRRGRAPTGPQKPGHRIDAECEDLLAVARATGARRVFGHSFGGLVVLETARREPAFDELHLYEPGVSIAGSLDTSWLAGYERLLREGDRRGAFAWMVKNAGFAPRPLPAMPLWYVKAVLRLAIRGARWSAMDPLLEANLVEHRIGAALDAADASRFAAIGAVTHLLAGERSPDMLGGSLLQRIAAVIPRADVDIMPGLGHLAPEENPVEVADAIRAATGMTVAAGSP